VPRDERVRDASDRDAPDPEDSRKPDKPQEITKPAWTYVVKKTVREFTDDQCTDLAAALTYYAVLALFPALIVVVSLLGVFGQSQQSTDALVDIVESIAPGAAAGTVESTLDQLSPAQSAAGFGLVLGLLGALWSASGYVGAFARAMNRIYEAGEGRPFWKLRLLQLAITLAVVVLVAVVAVALVVSGPVARAIGDAIGLGDTAVTVWQIAKWPVLVAIVILIIALLYWATPNVQQPKFRWMSMGAFIALIVWVLASAVFAFYVANFSSYDATYGALAGVVILLLWLWITNLALLFGAEFDAETERGRELQAGVVAEEDLQLPPRDTTKLDKKAEKDEEELAEARRLRSGGGQPDQADGQPAQRGGSHRA
jgi:membrane protein